MIRRTVFTASLIVVAVGSCANGATSINPAQTLPEVIPSSSAIAITNVHVITMTNATRLENHTVVIRDGRIVSIEPDQSPLPDDVTVIDGRGRVLMPALIDMHVHLRRRELASYLAAGVTTVRNMWGHADVLAIQQGVVDGTVVAPTVHSASNGFDGNPPQWPYTRIVVDARQADAEVASAMADGWKWIKVYQRLSAEVYDSIVSSAKRRGIPFLGHVPTAVSIHHALDMGQRSIEHLSGYDRVVTTRGGMGTYAWIAVDESRFADLARRTVQAGTWNCPTMAIYAALARQQQTPNELAAILQNRRRFIATLAREGARLLAGTDAGIDVVSPSAIHDELQEFVAAGLSPFDALRAATTSAAEFLDVPGLGTITAGAPAELLMLDADPLASIANTSRISGIVARGTWYSAAALAHLVSQRP
jgi:imidazolonepropionase-like amidohydrolase